MTPRLKVQEQKQHGQRTGGPTTTTRTKRRRHLEQQKAHASRADRASRSRVAAEMLKELVFPAIRDKMFFAKTVILQWDNAVGHGMSSIDAKIADDLEDDLPSPAPGVPAHH